MAARGGPRPVAPGRAAWPGPAAYGRDWAARAWGWVSSVGGGYWALAVGMLAVYNGWPGTLFGARAGAFDLGVLWLSPGTGVATYNKYGDQPWYAEYHWHGIHLITGNAYVLGGLVLLGVLMILAWAAPSRRPAAARAAAHRPAADSSLSNAAV